jgi:hypothetical protein
MSSAAERRKAMKSEMAQRQAEGYSRKDDSGKFKKIYVEGLKKDDFWKCDENDHSIDILPYIAGANNPHVKEGKPAYILDVWVHRKVGVNEDDYICLSRTYNEPCPICEYQNELRKTAKNSNDPESYDDEIKALSPTRRAIYNLRSWDKKDDPDQAKVWDVSHFLFEKELLENAKKKRGGGFVLFADPDEGKIVSFRAVGKDMARKYTAFEFEDRSEVISDEMLDKSRCLDELIRIPTYEEVQKAFAGREEEVEERAEARETRTRRPDVEKHYKLEEDKKMPPKKEPEDVPEPEEIEGCPFEYVFGTDNDKFDECGDCDKFDECNEEMRRLRKEARKSRETVKEEPPKAKEEPKEEPKSTRRRRPV